MRKHFKNWSILATIIGGSTIGLSSSTHADMDIMHMADVVRQHVSPVMKYNEFATQSGIAAKMSDKRPGNELTQEDMLRINPDNPIGKFSALKAQAKLKKGKRKTLVQEEQQGIPSGAIKSGPRAIEIDESGNEIPGTVTQIDPEVWQSKAGYRVSWWTLNGILSPAHLTEWGFGLPGRGMKAVHKWIDDMEPGVGKTLSKVLALPLDGLSWLSDKARNLIGFLLNKVNYYHDMVWDPNISWGTKLFMGLRVVFLGLAAKAAAAALMALFAL